MTYKPSDTNRQMCYNTNIYPLIWVNYVKKWRYISSAFSLLLTWCVKLFSYFCELLINVLLGYHYWESVIISSFRKLVNCQNIFHLKKHRMLQFPVIRNRNNSQFNVCILWRLCFFSKEFI